MSSTSVIALRNANQAHDKMGIGGAATGGIQRALIECVKKLAPVKSWAYLVGALGVSDRLAKHRMSGTRDFSAEELVALLHTEDGYKVLAAVMVGAKPLWWRLCVPLMKVAEARQLEAVARRCIESAVSGALDEQRELSATIAHAESLAFHQPEFLSPHIDGLRSMAGPGHRAMAETAKKQR